MSDDPLETVKLTDMDVRAFLPAALSERWQRDADADTRRAVAESLNRLLGALTTYLPRHLLHDLMQQPIPARTLGQFLSSTVLFADVSGFTAMSERLTAQGREGAETLTSVINDYFMAMSDIAAHHGGDLMLFGGDAMLLLFDGADHALRACHTAWAMQQAMTERFAEVKTPLGTFPLRMAAGLGSGLVFAAALGSAESMHYAVMGPALTAMGHAEELAGGGRIILDEATRRLAGELTVEAQGDKGFARLIAEPTAAYTRPDPPVLDLPPTDDRLRIDWLAQRISAIAPFLPTGLLPRLLPDPAAALEGEHRSVTVLFVDFRDADALIEILGADDPGELTPRLNAAFDVVRAVVARYGGVVNKVSNGPAGPHLIAMFGAPTSHEDDPERAVQTALDIRAALGEAGLPGVYPVRIGVNTGFVYAAHVGSHARREYTVMGDQVNLAARLMTAAQPGEIVVSASTAAHVEGRFDLTERQPVALKGKAQPQRNFVVSGARRRVTGRLRADVGEMLDREQEVAIGRERIDAAHRGQGQILYVVGEAGIGKSRLVETLTGYARSLGFELVGSACVSYGGNIPYAAWLDALRGLIDVRPSDADADRRARLQAALVAIDRADDAPIVAEVLGVPLADTTWTASLDAQARQRRLFDAVTTLVRHRAQQQALVWFIDDAHWIDPASLDLLNHLARHVDDVPLALVVASRRENRWTGWTGLEHATAIELPPLDRASIEGFLADVLGLPERRLPLAVRTLLERMASGVLSAAPADASAFERYWGNPFFAQERVRALIDAGVLARDPAGQWQVTRPIESIEMPDTIHGVIMSRIDRLPESARRVLQVAAVIGRTFDLPVLQAVHDAPDESLDALRGHLEHLGGLGVSLLDADQTRYTFRSVTTQEVAYDSLRYERRRELHRRIGEYLEQHVTLSDDLSGLLTHHYFEGQMWSKALGYALEAGWRAQQKYANAAAAAAYRRALQAAERLSPPRTLEQLAAHEALGDVLSLTGEYDAAQRHYDQARDLAAADSRHVADLYRKIAETHEKRSGYDEAFACLAEGLKHAMPQSIEAARIYLMGAGVFHRQGKHDQAADWCEKSLSISRTLKDEIARRAEAHALYLLAGIYHKRGDLAQTIEAAQRAVNVYLLAGDWFGQSQALNTLANAYSDQGDFAASTRAYSESLELKERVGDVAGQAMITLNLGENYRQRGDLAHARQTQLQSLRMWRDLGNAYAVALLHNNLAATALAEGKWDEADAYLTDSEKLFAQIGSEDFKAELYRHRAELCLGRGQSDQAVALAGQAVEAAEESSEKLEIGLSRRVLGQACLAQATWEASERELRTSLSVLDEVGSPVEVANTHMVLAQLCRRRGRVGEARQALSAAMASYAAAGADALVARAQAALEEVER